MVKERAQNRRIRKHLWRQLESEHRQLEKVLGDVQQLAAVGSYRTAKKRFGEFRLAHERHLVAERKLVALCERCGGTERFVARVRRERARMLDQTDRVWSRLCEEKVTHLSRMLARLAALVAKHEDAQRRLILGKLRLSPEQRRAHAELLRDLGAL